MNTHHNTKRTLRFTFPIYVSFLLFSLLSLNSCEIINSSEQDPTYFETLVQLQVQQTMVAEEQDNGVQLTLTAQNATQQAQQAQVATQQAQIQVAPPTLDPAIAVQETIQALQTTQQAEITPTDIPQVLEPSPTIDLESMMKSANILLYEDMVSNPDTNRYVKDTLDRMGLPYKDDGNAQGWLKSDILSGAPNGEPWDLVIIAAEAKSGVQGEFFEYVMDVLNQGSSVILEVWYLDKIAGGSASTLLQQCGVAFEKDWSKVPPSRMVMFPLDASHPIMREPNTALSFTKVTSYWWDETDEITYNIGDWVKIVPGGDAKLLVGTIATEKNTHGTITVCMEDRLILQTFSSHQLSYESMSPVWENYIHNALKVRFQNLE